MAAEIIRFCFWTSRKNKCSQEQKITTVARLVAKENALKHFTTIFGYVCVHTGMYNLYSRAIFHYTYYRDWNGVCSCNIVAHRERTLSTVLLIVTLLYLMQCRVVRSFESYIRNFRKKPAVPQPPTIAPLHASEIIIIIEDWFASRTVYDFTRDSQGRQAHVPRVSRYITITVHTRTHAHAL